MSMFMWYFLLMKKQGRPPKKSSEKHTNIRRVLCNEADLAEIVALKRVLKVRSDSGLFLFLLHSYRKSRAEDIKHFEEIRQATLAVKNTTLEPFIRETALFALKSLAEYLLKKIKHADQG